MPTAIPSKTNAFNIAKMSELLSGRMLLGKTLSGMRKNQVRDRFLIERI
jgi:hypothetical protein